MACNDDKKIVGVLSLGAPIRKVQGEVGPQGPPGPTGPAGERGPKGDTGERGPIGERGPKGERGKSGEKGDRGEPGPQGLHGFEGKQGPRGLQGERGLQGVPGPVGPRGPIGITGERGERGPQGLRGEPGPRGERGEEGRISWDNSKITEEHIAQLKGEKGEKGDRGERGERGAQGPRGLQGEQGIPGPKGDRGEQGQEGPQGKQGEKGIPGEKGAKGDRGERGPVGATGAKGNDGFIGPRGLQGEKGEKGDPGIQGPRGPQGEQGRPGLDGTVNFDELTDDQKEFLRGPQGEPGRGFRMRGTINRKDILRMKQTRGKDQWPLLSDGDTYYVPSEKEIWVWSENAPEDEYTGRFVRLKQLEGPQGPRGEQGEQGKQGDIGPIGPKGAMGPIGPIGPKGEQGTQGKQGPIGATGPKGEAGPQGPRGERGPKGENGTSLTILSFWDNWGEFMKHITQTPHTFKEGDCILIKETSHYNYGSDRVERKEGCYLWNREGNTNGKQNDDWKYLGPFRGLQGPQGEKGDPGIQGPVGPTGPQGAPGPTGPQGPTANIDALDRKVNDYVKKFDQYRATSDTQFATNAQDHSRIESRIDGLDSSKANKNDVYSKQESNNIFAVKDNIRVLHTASNRFDWDRIKTGTHTWLIGRDIQNVQVLPKAGHNVIIKGNYANNGHRETDAVLYGYITNISGGTTLTIESKGLILVPHTTPSGYLNKDEANSRFLKIDDARRDFMANFKKVGPNFNIDNVIEQGFYNVDSRATGNKPSNEGIMELQDQWGGRLIQTWTGKEEPYLRKYVRVKNNGVWSDWRTSVYAHEYDTFKNETNRKIDSLERGKAELGLFTTQFIKQTSAGIRDLGYTTLPNRVVIEWRLIHIGGTGGRTEDLNFKYIDELYGYTATAEAANDGQWDRPAIQCWVQHTPHGTAERLKVNASKSGGWVRVVGFGRYINSHYRDAEGNNIPLELPEATQE